MAWYDSAVFYHIHPLSLCGCEHESTETRESHFDELTEWAEHAKKMGCNAIYLGPVFETETHGCGIVDYYKTDRRLGTNEDLKKWVAKCHSMGMHVIIDCVFNHVGRGFFAFSHLRKHGRKSMYKEWFSNVNFFRNNKYGDGFRYESWGGYDQLVKLNLLNPWMVEYHLDTVQYWIREFDIDGIRIDAVEVQDYDFIKELRRTAQQQKPDFWLLGEIPDNEYGRWVNDKMLHSAANHDLHKALVFAHNDCGYAGMAKTIRSINERCPDEKLYTFVDNYNESRIYEKLNQAEHRYLVTLLQYTLWGIPSLYAGSEFSVIKLKRKNAESDTNTDISTDINTDQNMDENSTEIHILDLAEYQDAYTRDEITYLHCLLGRACQQFPELAKGIYKELLFTDEQFAFGRVLNKSAMITVVNNENSGVRIEIPVPIHAKKAVDMLEAVIDWKKEPKESLDLSGCRELEVRDSELILDLPANGGMLIWVTG